MRRLIVMAAACSLPAWSVTASAEGGGEQPPPNSTQPDQKPPEIKVDPKKPDAAARLQEQIKSLPSGGKAVLDVPGQPKSALEKIGNGRVERVVVSDGPLDAQTQRRLMPPGGSMAVMTSKSGAGAFRAAGLLGGGPTVYAGDAGKIPPGAFAGKPGIVVDPGLQAHASAVSRLMAENPGRMTFVSNAAQLDSRPLSDQVATRAAPLPTPVAPQGIPVQGSLPSSLSSVGASQGRAPGGPIRPGAFKGMGRQSAEARQAALQALFRGNPAFKSLDPSAQQWLVGRADALLHPTGGGPGDQASVVRLDRFLSERGPAGVEALHRMMDAYDALPRGQAGNSQGFLSEALKTSFQLGRGDIRTAQAADNFCAAAVLEDRLLGGGKLTPEAYFGMLTDWLQGKSTVMPSGDSVPAPRLDSGITPHSLAQFALHDYYYSPMAIRLAGFDQNGALLRGLEGVTGTEHVFVTDRGLLESIRAGITPYRFVGLDELPASFAESVRQAPPGSVVANFNGKWGDFPRTWDQLQTFFPLGHTVEVMAGPNGTFVPSDTQGATTFQGLQDINGRLVGFIAPKESLPSVSLPAFWGMPTHQYDSPPSVPFPGPTLTP